MTPLEAKADDIATADKALILNKVHILAGDGISFNLGQKLKRSEASAFIVKILGAENAMYQQKSKYVVTNFKDVPQTEWYAPYVGYLVQNSIISGMPDGTFKPDDYVSEKAFLSMLLKTMGYTSADYNWDSVYKVAFEAGILDDIMFVFKTDDNTSYLRGNVVDAVYAALKSNVKGQSRKLIQNQIDSKMIESDLAESLGLIKIDRLITSTTAVKANTANRVSVSFNEEIEQFSKDNVSIYLKADRDRTLEVKNITWDGTTLSLDTGTQIENQDYVIVFNTIKDKQGNKVDNIQAEFVGFNTPELISAFFKISKVEPINDKSINVYFTHPLNEKAEVELLYDIYLGDQKVVEGGYKTLTVKRNQDKKNVVTLNLKESALTAGEAYSIKVRGDLKSAFGVNLNKGAGDSGEFKAVKGTINTVSIVSSSSDGGKYVSINYSQAVDRESALKPLNYTIKEKDTGKNISVLTVYASKELAQLDKTFVLKTDGMSLNKVYEVTVNYVQDFYKSGQLPVMKTEYVNTSTSSSDEIRLETVFPINKYLIVAAFNRELKPTSSNASVGMEGGPIIVMKEVDPENPKLMKLYLSSTSPLSAGKSYTIRFYGGVYDFVDRPNTTTLTATVAGSDVLKQDMAIESAQFIDDGMVLVKFNQPIHATINKSLDKYEFSYYEGSTERLIIPSSIEIVGEDLVLLKMPYLMGNGTYQLRAKYIYDKSGQFSSHILTSGVK